MASRNATFVARGFCVLAMCVCGGIGTIFVLFAVVNLFTTSSLQSKLGTSAILIAIAAFFFWLAFLVFGRQKQFENPAEDARVLEQRTLKAQRAAEQHAQAMSAQQRFQPGVPPPYAPSWGGYGSWPYYRRMNPAQAFIGGLFSLVFMVSMAIWLFHGLHQDCTTHFTTEGSAGDTTSHMTTSCK